ncbi:MAG: hypothetical protein FJ303_15150 [Planctomycetes bacterium]|nr:hypothetical protein [Planctomycetota bacterium]
MQLTLRTLLSYLDDMLEPAQASEIGAKVADSEKARELTDRIKQVTHKRRLTAPPPSGPGGIDPNTIAEYLDNEVTGEQAKELEQICLASDVHLAEVAACHQILTLVFGEPALVPPNSKQRMYQLVKGPESIPFRKPPKPTHTDEQDLSSEIEPTEEEAARLGITPAGGGVNQNLFLIIGGSVLAVCLLAVALWQLLTPPPTENKQLEQITKNETKDPPKTPETKKDNDPGKKPVDQKKQPEKIDTTKKKEEKTPEKKDPGGSGIKIVPVEIKETPVVPYDKANPAQEPTGVYVDSKEPNVLMRKTKADWERISGKNAKVNSGVPLVAFSGSKSVVQLNREVELTLWGNLPEVTLDGATLESRVILHVPAKKIDCDVTLERGRIALRNKNANGNDALVRVRFDDPTQAKEEFIDITLNGSDAAVVVERLGFLDIEDAFFENKKDPLRKGPIAIVNIFALEGSANVRFGERSRVVSEFQQGMLQWQSRAGTLEVPSKASRPGWLKGAPELKDPKDKPGRDKAIAAHLELAKALESKKVDVALAEIYQSVQKNADKETIGGKIPSLDTYARWRHAMRCSAAIDDLPRVYDDFTRDRTPLAIRGLCMYSIVQWLSWNREQDYEMVKVLSKAHNSVVSTKIMELFHGVSAAEAEKAITHQHLVDGLNNNLLPIRTLSHWNLLRLWGQDGAKIPYDPSWSRDERIGALAAWRALIAPMPKKEKD